MLLINVLAMKVEHQCSYMLMASIEWKKIGVAIAQYLLKAIKEIGSSNVLQVATNNAVNFKAVGKEIQKVYNYIFWSPCVMHTLNMIFKDFTETFEWLKNAYKQGKAIVKYILNHN